MGNLLPSVSVTVRLDDAPAGDAFAGAGCKVPELTTKTRRYGSPVAGSRPNAELISFSALLAAVMSPNANAAAHTHRTAAPMRVPFIPVSSIVAFGGSVKSGLGVQPWIVRNGFYRQADVDRVSDEQNSRRREATVHDAPVSPIDG